MSTGLTKIPLLARREIEARIAGPLLTAFMREFGREKTFEVAEQVILSLARESGRQWADFLGGNTLEDYAKGLSLWSRDDALQFEIKEQSAVKMVVHVTRCRYAEMYQELGLTQLGELLSCGRDFAMVKGFNPKMKLIRTQTIMEGALYCDFCFELVEK